MIKDVGDMSEKEFQIILDQQKYNLDQQRPIQKSILKKLKEQLEVELTQNSVAIEGSSLSVQEVGVILRHGITVGGKPLREHFEVINHLEAFYFIEQLIKNEKFFSEYDIKSIHSLVMKNLSDDAGSYRKGNVIITGAKHKPKESIFINQQMEEFIYWYKGEAQSLHPIERAAKIHIIFVGIHPFSDGNGRTSRLLMNLELLKAGFPITIIKNENRLEYYQYLDLAHTTGEFQPFLNFVYNCVQESFDIYGKVLGIDLKKNREMER